MKKKEKNVFKSMKDGEIPEELVLISWKDITQFSTCPLGENLKLVKFHSGGVIVNSSKDQVDLQQTWSFEEENKDVELTRSANMVPSFPLGCIDKIYRYKLVK
jgi:hypothetical protein